MERGFGSLSVLVGVCMIALLAVAAVIAVNPLELSKVTRDETRIKEIAEIGKALARYNEGKNGVYPYETVNWLSDMRARGDLRIKPASQTYDDPKALCTTNPSEGYCYDSDSKIPPRGVIAYTKLESVRENTKCNVSLGETAWALFDTQTGRSGIVCTVGREPIFLVEGQQFTQ